MEYDASTDSYIVDGQRISAVAVKAAAGRAFVIKDSGKRQEFSGGMVRDTQDGKIDWWRVRVGPMLKRWAIHLTKGNIKYPDVSPGTPNWTLAAGEEEMFRFRASADRHFAQWMDGDVDEDHAAAIYFNVSGYEYCKEKLDVQRQVGS